MPTVPQSTEVILYKGVPLSKSYENVMLWKNVNDRDNAFNGFNRVSFTTTVGVSPISYQDAIKGSIKVVFSVLNANNPLDFNYLRFRNPQSTNQGGTQTTGWRPWIYAFIDKCSYINNNTWEFFYTIDVFTSFQFNVSWRKNTQFIERCHVDSDNIGDNTVDEGIEKGDYILTKVGNPTADADLSSRPDWCQHSSMALVILESGFTIDINDEKHRVIGRLGFNNNIPNGAIVKAFDAGDGVELSKLEAHLNALDESGGANNFISMYLFPSALIGYGRNDDDSWQFAHYGVLNQTNIYVSNSDTHYLTYEIKGRDSFGGYTPHNNKLYTDPYYHIYVRSSDGDGISYALERFSKISGEPYVYFKIYGEISQTPQMILYPVRYKTTNPEGFKIDNFNEGLVVKNFAFGGWSSNTYKNWVAQNQFRREATTVSAGLNLLTGVGMGAIGIAMGAATGGVGAAVGAGSILSTVKSTATTALNLVAERKTAELLPNQLMGNTTACSSVATNEFGFNFYTQHITREFAERIDTFFDRFGYAYKKNDYLPVAIDSSNNLVNHRPFYTYVKTVGCTLQPLSNAGVQSDYLDVLNAIFDKGITVWNGAKISLTSANFGNFNHSAIDNSIRT